MPYEAFAGADYDSPLMLALDVAQDFTLPTKYFGFVADTAGHYTATIEFGADYSSGVLSAYTSSPMYFYSYSPTPSSCVIDFWVYEFDVGRTFMINVFYNNLYVDANIIIQAVT